MASTPQRRPGGRTARTRAAVHAAVRELLAAGGAEPSVREVAELSGVHEVTIYRRWGSIEALLLDVATAQLVEEWPFPDTGDLRADLLAWAGSVAEQLRRPEGFAFFHAVANAMSPASGTVSAELREQAEASMRSRAAQIQRALDREAANGGHPPTVDMVFDLVLAPLYLRAMWNYEPETHVEVFVDRALRAAQPVSD
ncbi:TetR/AcrR family transcriptional regulator [Sciscionella sediminilitoris]|uniref:TetR/AcrR family transcriptional regulator n=1 Tax=Sciscionella sediminilitoris TaxID=1445613 RepID=UPI0004DF3866|nr:TetR/AcrR family transcriptional regulator [Sciscionella sp. SE31]